VEQEFDFYSVALAKLLQTVPELGSSIVTFKDVTEDLKNESDIKVGVFVLRVGNEIFYVPVISKMDNVYPVDSIFFASKGKFFPITKKTTDMIITSSKLTQGKPSKIPAIVNQNPDVTKMINPPRTGKFVYASASRLGDFLESMPNYLKTFTLEKIAEEKSVYEKLHKLFSLQDIFAALTPKVQSLAAVTNASPISIVTGAATNLSAEQISSILNDGFHVSGTQPTRRIAISSQSYDDNKFTSVTEIDGNSDHEVMFSNGSSREAFIPKAMDVGVNGAAKRDSVALFANGDYAISDSFVTVGAKLDRTEVLESIFGNLPPVLPADVSVGDTFAVISGDAELLGVFNAHRVTITNLGIEIQASARGGIPYGSYTLLAYRNYGLRPQAQGKTIYMPYSSLVLKLKDSITGLLERSVNSAAKTREITEAGILGEQLDIGFDGIEYSVNGLPIGGEHAMMNKLAAEEGIDPSLAKTFIKQAAERGYTKIYLTKRAGDTSFKPAEIPKYGQEMNPAPKVGLNGSFMPNVTNALKLGDAQTAEVTIISELLQTPDMYELIEEYLPDIEECMDKLGRTLFLARVNISELAENNDADGVFAFLASLKAVYRMLGDNFLKLQEMLAIKPEKK
jgi:hypothetical protein